MATKSTPIPRVRPRVSFKNSPSMTKQAFAKDADINNIMDKYTKTGVLPSGTRAPMFGDFSSGEEYQSIQNKLIQAQSDFSLLPSDVRELFDNDVKALLDFASNPDNAQELENLLGIGSAAEGTSAPEPTQPDARSANAPSAPTDPEG